MQLALVRRASKSASMLHQRVCKADLLGVYDCAGLRGPPKRERSMNSQRPPIAPKRTATASGAQYAAPLQQQQPPRSPYEVHPLQAWLCSSLSSSRSLSNLCTPFACDLHLQRWPSPRNLPPIQLFRHRPDTYIYIYTHTLPLSLTICDYASIS